jgi:tRNA-splicing ligase RtcB
MPIDFSALPREAMASASVRTLARMRRRAVRPRSLMKAKELSNLGVSRGPVMKLAQAAAARAGLPREPLRRRMRAVIAAPTDFRDDPVFGEFARALSDVPSREQMGLRDERVPYRMWGRPGEDFDAASLEQLKTACTLSVARAAAIMPDAHVGYGLPIGGVLATENAVIPYAVGVDIACRVKLTVLDMPASTLESDAGRNRLTAAIEAETRFGMGAKFASPRDHAVMDADWSVSPVTKRFKDKARSQLGTSGSGNHFVEFGVLTVDDDAGAESAGTAGRAGDDARGLGLEPGVYLALLSHSGSRGVGASVCNHYSRIAMDRHAALPKGPRHLAWLDLDSQEGREYWAAMNLMGAYASANHACIHAAIARHLGAAVIAGVENHHNFAWKEVHDPGDGGGPRELIVHRKGATPASAGELGVIPGSMADPCFVVRGLGEPGSLRSASHGAGRVMSRSKAKSTFTWSQWRRELKDRGVTVLSAGIDEAPGVYKDIRRVMAQQRDLVEPIARFDPKLVKMAPDGERAED